MECGIILKVVIDDKTDKRETSDSRELEWCTVFVCAWFVVFVLYLKREKQTCFTSAINMALTAWKASSGP